MSRSHWIALGAVLAAGAALWVIVGLSLAGASVEWGTVGEWVGGLGAAAVAAVLGWFAIAATRRTNALMEAGLPAQFRVEYINGIFTLYLVEGRTVVIEGLSKYRVIYLAEVEGEGDRLIPHADGGEEELASVSGVLPQFLHVGESLSFMPLRTPPWAIVKQREIPLLTTRVHYRVVKGSPVRTVEVEVDNPAAPELRDIRWF